MLASLTKGRLSRGCQEGRAVGRGDQPVQRLEAGVHLVYLRNCRKADVAGVEYRGDRRGVPDRFNVRVRGSRILQDIKIFCLSHQKGVVSCDGEEQVSQWWWVGAETGSSVLDVLSLHH